MKPGATPPRQSVRPQPVGARDRVWRYRTSPLYTFKTISYRRKHARCRRDPGALSLVLWTLFIITTVKYVSFAMRVDNDAKAHSGLDGAVGVKKRQRPTIVAVGLFGAALIYARRHHAFDLGAVGAGSLEMATRRSSPTSFRRGVILLALFAIQSQGTAKIGHFFGPVMLVWFLAIALMGVAGIVRHPSVLAALDPSYGLHYLFGHGATGFLSWARCSCA